MDKALNKYIEKYRRELKALENEKEMLQSQMLEKRGVTDIVYYTAQISTLDNKIKFWKSVFNDEIDV
jgi:hypothetical protein